MTRLATAEAQQGELCGFRRILVAEDDADMLALLVETLRHHGSVVHAVADATSMRARILVFNDTLDLIVSDVRLPGGSGLCVLEDLRCTVGATPVILMTAFSDDETRSRAHALGATLLDKPFDMGILRAIVTPSPKR